ncbi:unnamed protein product [Caenorhabditis auriculariae]|uniref:Uncharacterized protein n=1 Tax=Caenorhabditis auriculariae TaxID=2777116 RepID=A0A8S1HLI7_9PELO|nr:unnamed protein product [Caenorhabditis auriculariae]
MRSYGRILILATIIMISVIFMSFFDGKHRIRTVRSYFPMEKKKKIGEKVPIAPGAVIKPSGKWIVVTSVNPPTNDVIRLASFREWNLVVVGDTKTPKNWHLDGVHFLDVDFQKSLGFGILDVIPYKSYTRKNIGYLYAIAHGAEWIYDTDDDNKPYGKGLDQFDYTPTVSGLRYQVDNRSVDSRTTRMEKTGLDCAEEWAFLPSNRASSTKIPTSTPSTVFSTPMTSPGSTNASINSPRLSFWRQNTLFHRKAFLTLFLPVTVAFSLSKRVACRVAAISRQVYSQSGEIVRFLRDWNCSKPTIEGCLVELAEEFLRHKFWGEEDATLARLWAVDLKNLNYTYPVIQSSNSSDYGLRKTEENSEEVNCRPMNLDLKVDTPVNNKIPAKERAITKLENMAQLDSWCDLDYGSILPTAKSPLNYVYLSESENKDGFLSYYCLNEVKEMNLQNVQGYFLIRDDVIFNFWHAIDFSKALYIKENFTKNDYGEKFGEKMGAGAVQRINKKMSSIDEKNESDSQADFILGKDDSISRKSWSTRDFFYLPSQNLDWYAELIEIFHSERFFQQFALERFVRTVEYERKPIEITWTNGKSWENYNESTIGYFPLNFEQLQDENSRKE